MRPVRLLKWEHQLWQADVTCFNHLLDSRDHPLSQNDLSRKFSTALILISPAINTICWLLSTTSCFLSDQTPFIEFGCRGNTKAWLLLWREMSESCFSHFSSAQLERSLGSLLTCCRGNGFFWSVGEGGYRSSSWSGKSSFPSIDRLTCISKSFMIWKLRIFTNPQQTFPPISTSEIMSLFFFLWCNYDLWLVLEWELLIEDITGKPLSIITSAQLQSNQTERCIIST